MSFLDNLPHTVWVQNYKAERSLRDGSTQLVKDGPLHEVAAFVDDARSWSEAEEYITQGLQLKNLRVVYAKSWPGDVNSRVFFGGFEFLTEGEVARSSQAPEWDKPRRFRRLRHVRISLYRFGIDEEGISTGGA